MRWKMHAPYWGGIFFFLCDPWLGTKLLKVGREAFGMKKQVVQSYEELKFIELVF